MITIRVYTPPNVAKHGVSAENFTIVSIGHDEYVCLRDFDRIIKAINGIEYFTYMPNCPYLMTLERHDRRLDFNQESHFEVTNIENKS